MNLHLFLLFRSSEDIVEFGGVLADDWAIVAAFDVSRGFDGVLAGDESDEVAFLEDEAVVDVHVSGDFVSPVEKVDEQCAAIPWLVGCCVSSEEDFVGLGVCVVNGRVAAFAEVGGFFECLMQLSFAVLGDSR